MANVSPARETINRLPNPGIPNQTWLRMKKILRAVSRYQPDPFPSVRRLEKDTGIPNQTISRLLTRAEALGLISRTKAYERGSYTYKLLFTAPFPAPNPAPNGAEEEVLRTSSLTTFGKRYSGGPEARKKNMYRGGCSVCGFNVQPWAGFLIEAKPVHRKCEVTMNKYEREHQEDLKGPQVVGADTEAPSPVHSTRPVEPHVVLARKFDEIFNTEALKMYPAWRGEIVPSSRGATAGYIKNQLLPVYSPEHIEAFFDAFYDELLDPNTPLEVNPGQLVWQRFTGWFGTVAVADPKVAREHREWIEAMKTAPVLPPQPYEWWKQENSG